MLSVMQDGLQIQAVSPVLVKVAVQHQLCTQRRAADGLAVLHRNAGSVHRKGDPVAGSAPEPAVFPVVEMPQLFGRVCAEALQLGGDFPDGQPSGIFIGIGRQRSRKLWSCFRLFSMRIDVFQQSGDLTCRQAVPEIVWVQAVRRGCHPHQNREGLAAHRPRRAQHRRRVTVRHLCVCHRAG